MCASATNATSSPSLASSSASRRLLRRPPMPCTWRVAKSWCGPWGRWLFWGGLRVSRQRTAAEHGWEGSGVRPVARLELGKLLVWHGCAAAPHRLKPMRASP